MRDDALDDLHRAEAMLYELAIVLRRVPVDDHTRNMHVRALRLKRDVARWHAQMPDESMRQALLNELVGLQREAATWDALRREEDPCGSVPRAPLPRTPK